MVVRFLWFKALVLMDIHSVSAVMLALEIDAG